MKDTTHQFSHQTPRGEVALQEDDKISPWQEHPTAEDYCSRYRSHGLVESVETCCRENKPPNNRQVRKCVDRQRYSSPPSKAYEESYRRIHGLSMLASIAMGLIHP